MIPPELAHLDLQPHPEGGFYRECWRSDQLTVIDYLLLPGGFSGWHRVFGAEEVWNHHGGGRLALHLLSEAGHQRVELGRDRFSAVVPAGCWQAAEALDATWTLTGCTVAPPFRFEAFEMADASLEQQFPEHRAIVRRLLRT